MGVSVHYTDIDIIYLTRIYLVLLSLLFCWLMALISTMYTFGMLSFLLSHTKAVPALFDIPYIETVTWKYRFEFVTVLFIAMPFVIANIITIYIWPKISVSSPLYDKIFMLK